MTKYVTLLTTMFFLLFIFGLNTKAAMTDDYIVYEIRNGTVVITGYLHLMNAKI